MSTEEVKTNVRSADTWVRGLFILLFAVIYGIAEVVLGAIVIFQFGSQLFTGRTNDKLYQFSRGLTAYFYQLLQFFTYRSDLKPYPFSEWPSEGLEGIQSQERETQQKQPAETAKSKSAPKKAAATAKKSRPRKTTSTEAPEESTEKPTKPEE